MKNTETSKLSFTAIEQIIEARIAADSEMYDLDRYDIADIRLECYKANGWSFDPFPMEEEEEEAGEYTFLSMSAMLAEICMSEKDFF